MKTALFSPCFLDGVDMMGNWRLDRNLRYVTYYNDIQEELGFNDIVFLDNCSTQQSVEQLRASASNVTVLQCLQKLEKRDIYFQHDYPYVWRAFYYLKDLLTRYDKIIAIDSDCFVLSQKLAHHIRDTNTGFETFWVWHQAYPSGELFFLNKDAEKILRAFCSEMPYMERNHTLFERIAPFTHVNRDFYGDRFGEMGQLPQIPAMDWYGQASLKTKLYYKRFYKNSEVL